MLKYCYRCNTTHPVGQRCPTAPNLSGRAWYATRARIFARDDHRCQECGAPAKHLDHITPIAMGGSGDDSNLRALCARCNQTKGNS